MLRFAPRARSVTIGLMRPTPVSEAVPEGVAEVLRVSRALFVHSYFVYEFSLTAVIRACSRLRRACADAYDLIRATAERGLITADEASALDGARRLRNRVRGGVHLELCVLGMLSTEWHGSRPARS